MDAVVITLLALIVLALVILTAGLSLRKTRGTERGSLPGKGNHIVESNYSSGVGGGNISTFTVPKDPQEYAKRFVPKERKK